MKDQTTMLQSTNSKNLDNKEVPGDNAWILHPFFTLFWGFHFRFLEVLASFILLIKPSSQPQELHVSMEFLFHMVRLKKLERYH